MSLINEALKQARQAPPRATPNMLPLPPVARQETGPVTVWVLPIAVIVLIIALIFFGGWMVAHRPVREIVVAAPEPGPAPDPVEAAAPPESAKPVVPELPVATASGNVPVLQGIFYSPTAPSAIIDGKTVRLGDQIGQYYRVKEITQFAVTLIGPENKPLKIGLGR
ncbi:MAG: hypothetical protein WCH99_19790 [Verrucomicrobiota bacterium]